MEDSVLLRHAKEYSVLYVEDDLTVSSALEEGLRRIFGSVYVAGDGKAGLELFEKQKIDVIITDITMPIMDGLEMSRRIRDRDKNIPIIVTTAHNDERYFVNSFEIGITRYVVKPIDLNKLKTNIISAIDLLETRKRAIHYEERLIQDRINIEAKKITDEILNLYPEPTVAIHEGKAIFVNNAFMELYYDCVGELCSEDGFDKIFDKSKNYTPSFDAFKENTNNLVSITNKDGKRKIFLLKRQVAKLTGIEVLFFTLSDVTMLEYQRSKNQNRLKTIASIVAKHARDQAMALSAKKKREWRGCFN
jgi:YesN/AraC family two-component response regulator